MVSSRIGGQQATLAKKDRTYSEVWPGRGRAAVQLAVLAGIAVAALLAVATTRADVDLWGHVQFGLDTVDNGRIAAIDPYSFTSDRRWVNHEWLAEVLLASAWRAGGNPGLIALKLACIFGGVAFVSLLLRARGIKTRSQVLFLSLVIVGILPRVNHIRPQLFSVLLFAALLLILQRAEYGRRSAFVWAVPLIGLWCNLHGGWIVGLASLGLWTLGYAWSHRADGWRAWIVPGYAGLAALATLVNPYGAALWRFLLETVGFGREAIAEWGPLWDNPGLLVLWMIFAAIGLGAVIRGYRPRNPAAIVLPALWGAASLRVSRLDSFFALSVIAFLGPGLPWLTERETRGARSRLPKPVAAAIVSITIALLLSIPAARRSFTCVNLYAPWWPEPQAVEYMHERGLEGNIVTFFRWGEYGLWHTSPALKVSIDGRRETVYSERLVSRHIQLYEGTPEGLSFLDTLKADYVWFPRALPVVDLLVQRGWVPIFEGPQSAILAKASGRRAETAEQLTTTPEDRCFPGP